MQLLLLTQIHCFTFILYFSDFVNIKPKDDKCVCYSDTFLGTIGLLKCQSIKHSFYRLCVDFLLSIILHRPKTHTW